MKRIIVKKYLLFFVLFICLSCDPPHYIEFINNGNSELNVKLEIDSTITNYDLEYIEIRKRHLINLVIKKKDTAELHFGIGTWSDSEIEKLANSLKKITIENSDFKTIYKSKKQIGKFLKLNRKGKIGWETEIKIIIE
jgi:hypothetical protein